MVSEIEDHHYSFISKGDFILLYCEEEYCQLFSHFFDLSHCIHFDPSVINVLPPHVELVALKLLS